MTQVDFRSTLQRKLDVSVPAIATKLKSELRFELIRNLRSEGLHLSKKGQSTSLQERAYFSIVLDFLKRREFVYSLSVFLPECGAFSCEGDVLARHEILHTLGVPEEKCGEETEGMLPLLEQLTGVLRREFLEKPVMVDCMQQTVGPAALSLDEKLRKIELERPKESGYRGLEEKLMQFQKECERRSKQELDAELRRIRTLERQTVRLEEADRARRRHEQMETELRREYEIKDEQLRRKEQEALDRLKMKEAEIQRREGELRQETMRRMDELQKQSTLRDSSMAVQEERIELQRRAVDEQRRIFNEERDTFISVKQSVEDAAITKAERRVADDKLAVEQEFIRQRGEQQKLDAQLLALKTRETQQDQLEEQHKTALEKCRSMAKEKEEMEERVMNCNHNIADLKRQLETQIEQCRVDRQDRERLQAEVLLQQANERSSQAWRREEERRAEQTMEAHKLLQAQVENLRMGTEQAREEARVAKRQLDEALESHASQIGKTRVDLEQTWNLERRSLMSEVARVSGLHEQAIADQRNLRQDLERSRDDVQLKNQELRKLRDVLNDHLVSRSSNKENEHKSERVSTDVKRFLDRRDSARQSVGARSAPFRPVGRGSVADGGTRSSFQTWNDSLPLAPTQPTWDEPLAIPPPAQHALPVTMPQMTPQAFPQTMPRVAPQSLPQETAIPQYAPHCVKGRETVSVAPAIHSAAPTVTAIPASPSVPSVPTQQPLPVRTAVDAAGAHCVSGSVPLATHQTAPTTAFAEPPSGVPAQSGDSLFILSQSTVDRTSLLSRPSVDRPPEASRELPPAPQSEVRGSLQVTLPSQPTIDSQAAVALLEVGARAGDRFTPPPSLGETRADAAVVVASSPACAQAEEAPREPVASASESPVDAPVVPSTSSVLPVLSSAATVVPAVPSSATVLPVLSSTATVVPAVPSSATIVEPVSPLHLDSMFADSPEKDAPTAAHASAAPASPVVLPDKPLDLGSMFADSPKQSASQEPASSVVEKSMDLGAMFGGDGKDSEQKPTEEVAKPATSMQHIHEKVETAIRQARASRVEVVEEESVHSFSQGDWSGDESVPSSWG